MRILIVTVGGSCAPIVTSIARQAPDYVVFLCSDDAPGVKGSYRTVDGQGMVCGRDSRQPDQPSIVVQTHLSSTQYEVVRIRAFDDPDSCYLASHQALTGLRARYPDAAISADYTGGTKSMSVGLVLASLDTPGVQLSIVKGERVDLVKVQEGTQRVGRVGTSRILVERELARAAALFGAFDYPALVRSLEGLTFDLQALDLEQETRIQSALTLARGLAAWDRFDHATAWNLLLPHRRTYTSLVMFLEAVVHSRRRVDEGWGQDLKGLRDETPGHGYELVEDLLLNASRRATRGRGDDAVGRLYRALELLGQLHLLVRYRVRTSDVDLEMLPDSVREECGKLRNERGKIQLGLFASYGLLAQLEDPVGLAFKANEGPLKRAMEMRNHSLLAHGFRPITPRDYEDIETIVSGFCRQQLDTLRGSRRILATAEQFPKDGPISLGRAISAAHSEVPL